MAPVTRLQESDEDALLPVAIGTAVWLVALIVLLAMNRTLAAHDATWWIAVAAIGSLSGLLGLLFLRWRKGRARRRSQE